MSPSLPVLVFSLLAVSPHPSPAQDPAAPAEARSARAKQGLLPRKARPSRVTYLDGAARRRGEVREFPAAPTVDAAAPAVVVASEPQPEAADGAPAAEPNGRAKKKPLPEASVTLERARNGHLAARNEARAAESAEEAPAEEATTDATVEEAPAEEATTDATVEEAPAEEARADATAEEAADRARDDEAVSVGVLSERSVDRRGRIIERRFRRDLQLLSIRVVARIDDLPVVSSERLPDGRIRERVELEGSTLEVLRDAVGRFLSVRAAPGPEDGDEAEDEG